MATSTFKYTHSGQTSGYTYSNGHVAGSSPYTVGGQPIGTYTVNGHPLAAPHITAANLSAIAHGAVSGQSFLHSVEGLTTGVLNAFYLPARAAAIDVKNAPASLLAGPAAPFAAAGLLEAEGKKSHLVSDVAKPIAKSYQYKYGPAFHGHFEVTAHRAAQDPLGTFLDLATVVTLPFTEGASAGLEAGATAARGAGLARTADVLSHVADAGKAMRAERALTYTDPEGVQHTALLKGSPNPLTRGLQAAGDRLSARLPQQAYKGEEIRTVLGSTANRVARQETKIARREETRFKSAILKYRRALSHLSAPETYAAGVLSTGINTDGLLQMWHENQRIVEAAGGAVADHAVKNMAYLSKHQAEIDAIISDAAAHPQVLKAAEEAHKVGAVREDWILAHEAAKQGGDPAALRQILDERKSRQAEVAAGSRLVPEKSLGYEQPRANYQERRAEYNAATAAAQKPVPEGLTIKETPVSDVNSWRTFRAYVPGREDPVGELLVRTYKGKRGVPQEAQALHPEGEIAMIEVKPEFQRQGIGTELVNRARQEIPEIHHSANLSEDARAWIARSEEVQGRVNQATESLRTARMTPGAKKEMTIPEHWSEADQARLAEITSGIDPAYGGPSYLPHATSEQIQRATRWRTGKTTRVDKDFPGMDRTEYHNLISGDLILHPELLSRSVLRAAAFKGKEVMHAWALKYAKPLNAEAVDRSGVDPGYRVILPAGASTPQALAHAETAHHVLDTLAQKEDLNAWAKSVLPSKENQLIEQLNAQGAKQIPSWVAKRLEKEVHQQTNVYLRFFDRSLDVWRALVLNYRPAWLVNNIFGQHLLYFMKNLGPLGLRSYLRGLKLEKGDRPVRILNRWSIGHMPQRSLKAAFEDRPGGQDIFLHGAHQGILQNLDRAVTTGDRGRVMSILHKVDVGRAMRWANVEIADNQTRIAALASLVAKHPEYKGLYNAARGWEGVGGALKRIAEKTTIIPSRLLGEKTTLRDFIASLDEKQIRHLTELTDEMLGNFTELSPTERNILRRAIPFYSWFKVITTLSLRLGMHDPQRVNMILNLERASAATGIGMPIGPDPSYLQGSVAVGGEQGGVQPVLSTTGLNPFQTVTQLLQTGAGVAGGGKPQFGISGPLSLLNPGLGIAEQTQGIDPFYGSAYRGPLAGYGYKGRLAAAAISGLPQYRVIEQTHPGLVGSNYKSTLYANSEEDFWLNFLGLPIKRVNVAEAQSRAKAGQ